MIWRTWRFRRQIERHLTRIVRAAPHCLPGDYPPEVEFDGDPIYPMSSGKIAEFAASVIAYVLSERGSILDIDHGTNQMWMECPHGRIELHAAPSPLTVDCARRLLKGMDVRRIEAGPQPFIRLPDGRRVSIEYLPHDGESPTRRIRVAGFDDGEDDIHAHATA